MVNFQNKKGFNMNKINLRNVILIISCSFAIDLYAATQNEWFTIFDDKTGDHIAAVLADNGDDILAYRCFKKEQLCTVAIRSKIKCEDGATYPMLINSPQGSFMIEGVCTISSTKNYDQVLTPYKQISDLLYSGEGVLGFAIALKDGEFKAIRFNLTGATKKMTEIWQKVKKSGNSKNSDTF